MSAAAQPRTDRRSESGGRGPADTALETGTYEVLRARLAEHAAELSRRAGLLNQRRIEEFGGSDLTLLGTERIRTENNCVPRDVVALPDGRMVFGYNVFVGMRPETAIADVFAVRRFRHEHTSGEVHDETDTTSFGFDPADPAGLFDDPRFRHDFAELYRYYSQTRLLQLRRVEGRLLAVFQTGGRTDDIRVLRWQLDADGSIRYLDNRGERDHVLPTSHDFEWVETTRDDQVLGRYPHLSILDEVFVETLGGTLTIKVENNTESGAGVYSEPVDEPLQSLADAAVQYARLGPLILLRIRPYNETVWRHLVFNIRTKDVVRLDGIGQACRRLPEDHGIIFPGGYYLATGVHKRFDTTVADLEYERTVRSANGEDVLYVFHARAEGRTLLLPYNLVRTEVANPLSCHGYSLFDDGTMVVFRALSEEPTRVHPMQVWRSPFVSDLHAATQSVGTGPLHRVGNAELVRGISDCLAVARMVDEMRPATAVFEAVMAACTRAADHYHWLGETELCDPATPLGELRATAEQVLDEYEKVTALTAQATAAVDTAAEQAATLIRLARAAAYRSADEWVRLLADLRRAQGQLVTLRDLRYVDTDRIDTVDADLAEALADAGRRAVEFLGDAKAFATYHTELDELLERAEAIGTVADAEPLQQRLTEQTDSLQIVTEIVGALDIADATVRTDILTRIGEILAAVNRVRATVQARRVELASVEGRAAFAAEFALLGQAVTGALAVCDSPDACDDQLAKLLLAIENLETRFGEIDDFADRLTAKREDVYEAFTARKQALLDERSQRAERIAASAQRILAGVGRRAAALGSLDEVNTYFASDPMVARLRQAVTQLRDIGDQVRAEEFDGRLRAARQEAGRALRDRVDLYDDGGETIRLGRHRFAVDTRPVELTMVPHDGAMWYTITGTDYRAPVRDNDFGATRPYWSQLLASETAEMYRGEYLAVSILAEAERDGGLDTLYQAAGTAGDLAELVRKAAAGRYDEGYERGVHDHDGATILETVLRLYAGAQLLRFPSAERAAAQLWWRFALDADDGARAHWQTRVGSLARARAIFGRTAAVDQMCDELSTRIGEFADSIGLDGVDRALAGEYLFEELFSPTPGFITSAGARLLLERFHRALGAASATARAEFESDLSSLGAEFVGAQSLPARHQLVHAWLTAYVERADDGMDLAADLPEAVAIELCGAGLPRSEAATALTATVSGLLGTHPRITQRELTFRFDELLARCRRFRLERVPGFRAYLRRRTALVSAERDRLRLEEYRPRALSGFVRNRLLDEVYLPLIGDNLAKQLGVVGDSDRTDRSGLLLLISPPGYGKTTLMEYVAARLGLVLVKVNGPALGHEVTSVDPAQAPNATARQELEKINFALELGNNVLLYLDDIQHTSPELLQKFISLCDGQRRMEGVWDGRTRTYDLRGKRFAVCMAGNPYTEQGKRFRIPDMLANRADVWNLGDVLSGRDELFALSYIENALTTNPVLAPLSSRDRGDLEILVRMARGDRHAMADQLTHPYSATELSEITAVLGKLIRLQEVVLATNRAYIASAATADSSRTEPPFQLQGSYRNMNALAERVVPVMNDEELEALIDDHYLGEAQTLAAGAEFNLLKLAELRGRLSEQQARRWTEVKAAYLREQALGGAEDDPLVRAVGALGLLGDRIAGIESALRAIEARDPSGKHSRTLQGSRASELDTHRTESDS
ncbi:AAA domain-containing protein [Nocardia uniformis]|uniref:AAA domain-containing protein n=1 Tax=Nocardia uniformis TaxID=53432 RepID=A0A849C1R2_9NOCA|nr:DNA repair ATPase [Nocardia uniformis]NNH71436.1 AAA domain-containing protein [Nocardia uniformis]